VILTAAHCLTGDSGDLSFTLEPRVPLVPGSAPPPPDIGDAGADPYPDAGVPDGDGMTTAGGNTVYPVFLAHSHPGFNAGGANNDLGQVNDVGVAILRRPITTVPVEQIDTRMFDLGPGSEVHLTGYGVTQWYLRYSAGIKHDAEVLVDGVGDFEFRTSASLE